MGETTSRQVDLGLSAVCGRIDLHSEPSRLARIFNADLAPDVDPGGHPRWNVAPMTQVLALSQTPQPDLSDAKNSDRPLGLIDSLRWGLVPAWAKSPYIGNRLINLRADTVLEKGGFRRLITRARHRCLVLADGFYEWQRDPTDPQGRRKIPHYFHRADGMPLALAGVQDVWVPPSTYNDRISPLRTCTILTTQASSDVAWIHDRMPVIIEPNDIKRWIDTDDPHPGEQGQGSRSLRSLLEPPPSGTLASHRVGGRVNKVSNDGPELIEPDTGEVQGFLFSAP